MLMILLGVLLLLLLAMGRERLAEGEDGQSRFGGFGGGVRYDDARVSAAKQNTLICKRRG